MTFFSQANVRKSSTRTCAHQKSSKMKFWKLISWSMLSTCFIVNFLFILPEQKQNQTNMQRKEKVATLLKRID